MAASHHPNYKKIYLTLVILLAISVAGPFIGIKWVTIITAFGIAFVKANMVIQNFMHLKWERRIAKYVLAASGALLLLFYYGVAPDVQAHRGQHWVNDDALAATARGIPAPHGSEGGEAAHDEPSGGGSDGSPAAPAAAAAAAAESTAAPNAFNARAAFAANCSPCHGTGGRGDGVVAAALNPRPANFADPAFWRSRTDAVLIRTIQGGGAAVGKSASMPAWSSLLSEAQAADMVAYLKTLSH
ncbi:MAG: hypothetical protein A2085_02855 [Gemmatimonadetes bacterium GWC2_71_10]|nr:MAG: hypothetical protein A2085_02855 [Gemmatimonadetes bacterium GWC2_71_10]